MRVRFRDILAIPGIRVVVFVTFVIMLGFGILSPVLPQYARSFGVGYNAVGLLVSAFAIMRLVFDLVAGPLVDRYGERAMATTGAAIVGVSSALAAMAPNFTLLVIFRGAGGAGSAVFFGALWGYVIRSSPRDRIGRVMALFYGAFNLGIIAGQPLGGLAAEAFGLASPLWLYSLACFLSAALYLRYIRNPERPPSRDGAPRGIRGLPWNRSFVTVLVVHMAYAWMIAGAWSTLLPLFARESIGLSEVGVGLALAVASAAEFAVLFHAGAAADRYGRKAVMVPAYAALVIVVGLLGLATSVWMFAVGLALLGMAAGYGGVPPTAMLSDVTPPESSGTAVGVYRFVADLGFVAGPLVAGAAADSLGFPTAFAITAAPCLVALGMLLSIPETMSRGRVKGAAEGSG